KAGTLFLAEIPANPMAMTPPTPGQPFGFLSVSKFDLTTRKTNPVISAVSAFDLSHNGEKILYRQGDKWYITAAGGAGGLTALTGGGGAQALKTDDMEVRIDPRAEWKQMYREVWRLQRDFLYDPGFHGLNLAAAEKKYAGFLDGIAHRSDLNYLF